MGKPSISVILPVYNAEDTIEEAVRSILNQTYSVFELIVVNDGSTDKTAELLKSFADSRIQIVNLSTNQGVASAMNTGIAKATGKLIARMDADDVSHPQRLESQLNYLSSHPDIDLVASKVNFIGPASSLGLKHYVEWQNDLTSPHEIYLNRFADSPIINPSIMVRKEIFESYGLYSLDDIPEDYELWLRWMKQGVKISKIKKVLLDWRDLKDRLTRVHPSYSIDKFDLVKAQYFVEWFNRKFRDRLPDVWIVGSGRQLRKKTNHLKSQGLKIAGYIDFNPQHDTMHNTIGYDDISKLENPFFLSYIGDRYGKVRVKNYLLDSGFEEGQQFLMMN